MRHLRAGVTLGLLCAGTFACKPEIMNEVGSLEEGGDGSGATGSGAISGTGTGATAATSSGGSAGTETGSGATGGTTNSAEGGAGVEVYAKDPQNCGEAECPGPTDCSPAAGWAHSTATNGVLDFEPIEVWRGYVVNPAPPLPVDDEKVALYVKERTATSITGAVVFGEGESPPPATDPSIGYIPTEIYASTNWLPPTGSYDNLHVPEPWGGYALSLLGGAVTGSRVQFSAHSTEQWRGWCEMVLGHAVLGEVDEFSCIPSASGSSGFVCHDSDPACEQCLSGEGPDPSTYVEYDCRKFRLCQAQVCQCEGECCTASLTQGRFAFDLRLENDGTELNGSIVEGFGGSADWDVHLTLD